MDTLQPGSQFQQAATASQNPSWGQLLLDLLETVLLAVLLYLGINAVSARVRVDGFSMRPTLQDGQYILVNRLAYKFDLPQRGDIIVFRFPMNPKQDLIKRVIGLPGEEVRIEGGRVLVSGQALNEPYIAAPPSYAGQWVIPKDHLFVLGDNRNDSSDSHSWGLVPLDNVVGKAVLIYWPPSAWSLIEHVSLAVAP